MGLFDYVRVQSDDDRFTCSEGHQLGAEEFQSKDFGRTMGDVEIVGDAIVTHDGGWGDPPQRPLLGRFFVYCSCRRCPAFVQAHTCNLIDKDVTFEIAVVDDAIRSVRRVGSSTAQWLSEEPSRPYMAGARGPMSWDEAQQLHIHGLRTPWPRDNS